MSFRTSDHVKPDILTDVLRSILFLYSVWPLIHRPSGDTQTAHASEATLFCVLLHPY